MNLKLKITYEDLEFFRLEDHSTDVPVTGTTTLKITPPGFAEVTLSMFSDFAEDINTEVLGITDSTLTNLPQGLYKIQYLSGTTSVTYNYLHNRQQYKSYIESICSLYSVKSTSNLKDFQKSVDQLYNIKEKMIDAKYLVEECGKSDIGMDIFREVTTLLTEFKPCYDGCSSC